MEFTLAQFARLVLGYLKTEKCQTAFDAFLKASPHFEYCLNSKRSKYIVTRVSGQSLRDFLNEYSQIYNLIQERLEPTEYFEEHSSRSIVDQLNYLLEKSCPTKQSTPQRRKNIAPDLNTSPLEALPRNSQEYSTTPKKKVGIKTNRNTAVEESDSSDSPDNCQEHVERLEVLRQTLLEHSELHEQIAENINLAIKTSDSVTEEKLFDELDATIKTIVEKIEADPCFEKLINDLIGFDGEDGIDQRIQQQNEPTFNERETPFSTKHSEVDEQTIKRLQSTKRETKTYHGNQTETNIYQRDETKAKYENIQNNANESKTRCTHKRDNYLKYKKKKLDADSSTSQQPKSPLYRQLQFLDTAPEKIPSLNYPNYQNEGSDDSQTNTIGDSQIENSEMSIQENETLVSDSQSFRAAKGRKRSYNAELHDTPNSFNASRDPPSVELVTAQHSDRKRCTPVDNFDKWSQTRLELLSQVMKQPQEDDIDLFMKSMAMSIKKLPAHLIPDAKINVLQAICELGEVAVTSSTPAHEQNASDIYLTTEYTTHSNMSLI